MSRSGSPQHSPLSTTYPHAPLSRGRALAPKLDLTLRPSGTQFTCFTGTKVRILTQNLLLDIKPERKDVASHRQRVEVTETLKEKIEGTIRVPCIYEGILYICPQTAIYLSSY